MTSLPTADQQYLEKSGRSYREVEDKNQKGLILEKFELPEGKYQVNEADILILLPPGYSDVPPDMFYAHPSLTLTPGNRLPNNTQASLSFGGTAWQRWSRHSNQWRPGIDGIWTMIQRVERALWEAS